MADKTLVAVFHDVTFDFLATKWVGAVKDYQLLVELNTSLHEFAEGGDVGVTATTVVLDVVYHDINLIHHFLGRLAGFAIEAIHL